MKNKLSTYVSVILVALYFLSCADKDDSQLRSAITETKEKKVSKPLKIKKKDKKKSMILNKQKEEEPEVKVIDDKEERPATTENSSMTMLLANKIKKFAAENDYSTKYCFLVDMSLPSGKNRFFVYDLEKNSIINTGLVAHGSCNESFMAHPRFSNSAKSGCTSLGKYKVGEFYVGKYGKSFRLYGLDNSNSNAYNRAVVIHGYDCVPDEEIYPRVLCNSLGCVMVSYNFFDRLSRLIKKSDKPIVLWLYG